MTINEICNRMVKLGYDAETVRRILPDWWKDEMFDNENLRFELYATIAKVFVLDFKKLLLENVFEFLDMTPEQWRNWHLHMLEKISRETTCNL